MVGLVAFVRILWVLLHLKPSISRRIYIHFVLTTFTNHESLIKIQTDAMLSICMCVTEFDIVLGKCSLVNSSDVLRYNCAHVSEYGMRCLLYIPLARL